MLVRICPVCGSARPQSEIFCQWRDADDVPCATDIAREPLVPQGGAPVSVAPAEGRWQCASGHESPPGETLCWCGELIERVPVEQTFDIPAESSATGVAEAEQLPLAPLDAPVTHIGAWTIDGVDLDISFSEGPHDGRHDDGRAGLLTFSPDWKLIEDAFAACPDRIRPVLDRGEWHGRHYVVLASLSVSPREGFLDQDGVRSLVEEVGAALDRLHKAGICLRTLTPKNLAPRPLVIDIPRGAVKIDEVGDLVPAADLDPFYAAPEILAGSAALQSDWWSLGAISLFHLTRGTCFDGIHPAVWRMHVVTSGVSLPDDMTPEMITLLRGLLARDLARRWQWNEVRAWLAGEPVDAPETVRASEDRGSAITLGGAAYRNPMRYAIAAATEDYWDEACEQFERGELLAWCHDNGLAETRISALRRVAAAPLDRDSKLGIALKCVFSDLPLVKRGEIINANWLIRTPEEGYALITGPIADTLDNLGFEHEIVRLRDRAVSVRRRAEANQIELDEASVCAALLVTNTEKLAAQWRARRLSFPESEHRGLARIMRRPALSEEDLILLVGAHVTQFKTADEILNEAQAASRGLPFRFDPVAAAEALRARTAHELFKGVAERTADFARCGIDPLDAWADDFRANGHLPLSRALVLIACPTDRWKKPEGLEYSARILNHFENKIALSIKRGPLTRMSRSSERIDVTEFGTPLVQADRLAEAVLERGVAPRIDTAAFTNAPNLQSRLTQLTRRAGNYKRDTGIDCLVMGFPFVLHKMPSEDRKPRIAPLFLWPIKAINTAAFAFDTDRGVILNPALESFLAPRELQQAKAVLEDVKDAGAMIAVLDECERILPVPSKTLAALPPLDVKVETNRIVSAAVIFPAVFPGQALVNDLRLLQNRPVTGTALSTLLRLEIPASSSDSTPVSEADKYFVASIDPSQEEAILRAREGLGLLIEGPPGTGKSQTIVNLIADAIGRGKTLLFVCQKQAALDVVFNRLKAAQLQDRVVLVKDESRDRRTTVQALRSQAQHLKNSKAPSRLERTRADLAASIDRLERDLDAGYEAFFKVHDDLNLAYGDLLVDLVKLETGPMPRVRGLRDFLKRFPPQKTAALADECASLAAVWLPSKYEGSPLAVLKVFTPSESAMEDFRADFDAFRKVEAERHESERAQTFAFDIDDPAAARSWLGANRSILDTITEETRGDLARWLPLCPPSAERSQPLRKLITKLEAIASESAALEAEVRSLPSALWARLAVEALPTLEALHARAKYLAEPAGFFGWLSIRRYQARGKMRQFLSSVGGDEAKIDVTTLAEGCALALRFVQLRMRATKLCGQLVAAEYTGNAPCELQSHANGLKKRLEAACEVMARMAVCPTKADEAFAALASGSRDTAGRFMTDLERSASRAEMRERSLGELSALEPWFEPDWLEMMREKVRGNHPTREQLRAVERVLPTLGSYQDFRIRSVRASSEVLAVFGKLRASDNDLNNLPEGELGTTVRRLIHREARLGWKEALEAEQPDLRRDRRVDDEKIVQLEHELAKIRDMNGNYLREGVDRKRTIFGQNWDRLVLLQGPNALGIRDIINKGMDLGLMAMRPVWLMNPDVVSRALPLREGLFDVVVFDEASQIPVENALPALFRAKQVIVSGDEKQLPPTSFFASSMENASEEESVLDEDATEEERVAAEQAWTSNEIKDAPDLLHLARSSLATDACVMLKVHYRSEWRELVAFSNSAFYDGELSIPVLYPDAIVSREQPVRVLRVDGTYSNQTNRQEAEAVIDELANVWLGARSKREKAPTTGVVTFNLKQADLIADLIAERQRSDEGFAAAYGLETSRIEDGADHSFFVKNLENVQGDERDIILFSTTFGHNESGQFRRNFGILGQRGGERRLNVATTRAKQKMIIATSMPVEKISDCLVRRRRPETPRDFLQLYLNYAELVSSGQLSAARGVLASMPQGRTASASMDRSAFADVVEAFLDERNIPNVPMHDKGAFALDFAIEDMGGGHFCLGIECEAPRHPLLARARGRELWRPRTLRRVIPKIHRVSLQGWFANRQGEQALLLRAIDDALEANVSTERLAS
ncbi:histidine kinase [Rhodomicrobium udaipurense JA643]|uniref:DUF4011 domain-containing protein n=1 Tax=Rhodomicrobium udaipurense TaxID=1202716 RepID=A0A8I1KIF4_9HYPH|nr:AAA domain-containing protein [Rhodomicrobium udaipurense]KAI94681.1 histidine kinase [Rhodomicrobium udaipurense JA643]MBJ7542577.1 DUF4011 domain-containing protein [Rhodomicrobium udaipurense]